MSYLFMLSGMVILSKHKYNLHLEIKFYAANIRHHHPKEAAFFFLPHFSSERCRRLILTSNRRDARLSVNCLNQQTHRCISASALCVLVNSHAAPKVNV